MFDVDKIIWFARGRIEYLSNTSLYLPENILDCSNDPGSDVVIVNFGMQAPSILSS